MSAMKHILILFLTLNIYQLIACDYTVNLHDDFGDGWNGNTLTIEVNSIVVLNQITVDAGSDAQFNFSANPGDVVTVTYNNSGAFPQENELTITSDDTGNTIFASGQGSTIPSNGSISIANDCNIGPPPNNEPCGAINLPMNEGCEPTFSSNNGATDSNFGVPSCGNYNNSKDVWFETTIGTSGTVQINVVGISLNPNIAVYTGTDCNTLSEIVCTINNSFSSDELAPGTHIWIRIWGDEAETGSFQICAQETPLLQVDAETYTPQQLIEDILITGCLEASNVQYTGDPDALGYFESYGGFDFSKGIIMTTGKAVDAIGPNESENNGYDNNGGDNDNDLEELSGFETYDVATLEFDFVPSSDTVKFKYIFASEEYDEYVCGSVNDVFGFFISGPGINGNYSDNSINVALIPETDIPVSINTVNNGSIGFSGSSSNCDGGSDYYLGNSEYFQNDPFSVEMQYDGYTIALEAQAVLQACETYHIKLKIADGGDGVFDSAVMFEAGSFSSGGDIEMHSFSEIGAASDIYEGCQNYYVFERIDTTTEAMQDTAFIYLEVGGTATQGIDYSEIPNELFLLPGEITDTLFYTASFDNFMEGDEYIVFSLLNGCPCSQTSTQDTIWIKDNFQLNAQIDDNLLICEGEQIEINTEVNPNIEPFLLQYNWDIGTAQSTSPSITVSPTSTTNYTVTITNVCQSQTILTSHLTVVPTVDASFTLSTDTACKGEPVNITFNGSATQYAEYTWNDNGAYPHLLNTQGPHVTSWNTTGLKTIHLNIDDRGCLDNASAQIYVKEFDDLSLTTSFTDVSCFGFCDGTGTVNANNPNYPFTYQWDNEQTTQTATNLCIGNYKVTVIDRYGCKDTTHVSINTPTEMTFDISTDSASCYGVADGSIFLNVNGGTPPYSFNWSNGAINQNNTSIGANNYSVTITDNNGCTKSANNIMIYQPNEISVNLYGNHTVGNQEWICQGQTDSLTSSATGGIYAYTYQWSTSETTPYIVVQPQQTSDYWVQITDSRGCKSEPQNITVHVYDDVTFNAKLSTQSICEGEKIDINIDAFGGNGQYTYLVESIGETTSINNYFTLYPTESQDITISVTDNCESPYNTKTIPVEVNLNPVVSFTSDKTSGCEPLKVEFSETTEGSNDTYLWRFTNNKDISSISNLPNPIHFFEKGGTYDVSLTVTSDKGCTASLDSTNYILVFDKPIAQFEADDKGKTIIDRVVTFDNYSTEGVSYLWIFGDGNTSTETSPAHEYPNVIRTYEATLIASSVHRCLDTATQLIRITDEATLFVATAFSPNGDGTNEFFPIKGNGIKPEDFSLNIYDRWGMIIFQTTNYKEAWDGRLANGERAPSGLYYWVLKYRDANNVSREKSGRVNVIR